MDYALHRAVRCCEAAGRLFFLDVARDRYFCLRPDQESAFRRLAGGQVASHSDEVILTRLVGKGILERSSTPASIELRASVDHAQVDSLDQQTRALAVDIILIIKEVLVARLDLKFRHLQRITDEITEQKEIVFVRPSSNPHIVLRQIASALAKIDVLLSFHDRCLERSIAVMRVLLRRGFKAELIFGVSGRPFQAHCWVQSNNMVITDALEHVRLFTPILVL